MKNDIHEMIDFLCRNAWVQAMDIASLYLTSSQERFERNWTAIVKSPNTEARSSIAHYVPYSESYDKHYYSKDLEYAGIEPLGTKWKVFSEKPRVNFLQKFDDEINDFVIQSAEWDRNTRRLQTTNFFNPSCKYEVIERFADFDVTIAKDAAGNTFEYATNCDKLLNITVFPNSLPTERDEQLKLCADTTIPVLTIQGPPGTGKTSFLSDLIAKLLKEGHAPSDIHCLTQTRRARSEIRRKLIEKIKAGQVSGSAIPNNDIEGTWELDNCANTIFCETLYKNPGDKARRNKRKIILIDEASQIALPTLLYALRYANPNACIRVFGDQKQLDAVSSYVRDYTKLTGENTIKGVLGDFADLEQNFRSALSPLGGDIFSNKTIQSAQFSNMLSKWGRSYFNIAEFSLSIEKDNSIRDMMSKILLVRRKNYRQEEALHKATHETHYKDIVGHTCEHDYIAEAVEELSRHKDDEASRKKVTGHLFRDGALAESFWIRVSSSIKGGWDALVGVGKRLYYVVFGDRHREVITQQDRDNIVVAKPFASMGEEEFKGIVKDFFKNQRITKEMMERVQADMPSPDTIANSLWNGAREHLVVVSHDFRQDKKTNENRWEAVLACLFIRLWEKEMIRTGAGLGVVTPYRNQEVRITNLYLSAFPDSPLRMNPAWCATPERFQGRDLSRCIFSASNHQEQTYLEPTTMFSRNKLNVATSRASHQQVVIAHRDLLSEDRLREYKEKIAQNPNELEKKVLEQYPMQYREAFVQYCAGPQIHLDMIP